MAPSLKDRFCAHCGQPAVDARVEIDGKLTFLCAVHSPARAPEDAPSKVIELGTGARRRNGG
jgi:hypothetical protein